MEHAYSVESEQHVTTSVLEFEDAVAAGQDHMPDFYSDLETFLSLCFLSTWDHASFCIYHSRRIPYSKTGNLSWSEDLAVINWTLSNLLEPLTTQCWMKMVGFFYKSTPYICSIKSTFLFHNFGSGVSFFSILFLTCNSNDFFQSVKVPL
jgi:hypothetical protein